MSLEITILGCGSSGGVPRVAQGWGACDPTNPKNRRRRCALLLRQTNATGEATQVLVDMGADLRAQLIDAGVNRLDGILLTHSHADHTHGIDDLRPMVQDMRARIDLYMDAFTSGIVRNAFRYIFETPPGSGYPPLLSEHRIIEGQKLSVNGPGGPIEALPFRLHHGEIDALGFRFGDVAYTPDLNAIPDESVAALEGLDLWIVDALRYTRHPSHFCLEETLSWIERLRPKHAILTNLHTDLDFEELRTHLPPGVEPAFDGMTIRT
ncbi:MAG: MBL fold metallo-hydrolase [Beijerinckiaceae bacterium]|nr:MBL fold metallo-hydrolase [Beijerinckiaceae bacterium]